MFDLSTGNPCNSVAIELDSSGTISGLVRVYVASMHGCDLKIRGATAIIDTASPIQEGINSSHEETLDCEDELQAQNGGGYFQYRS